MCTMLDSLSMCLKESERISESQNGSELADGASFERVTDCKVQSIHKDGATGNPCVPESYSHSVQKHTSFKGKNEVDQTDESEVRETRILPGTGHDSESEDTESSSEETCEEEGEVHENEGLDAFKEGTENCACDALNNATVCTCNSFVHVPKEPVLNGDSTVIRSSLKRSSEDSEDDLPKVKKKCAIQFDGVTVFYFPRSQGFSCVPSQGGSTLGMSRYHFSIKKYSLSEHAAEQRIMHRDYLRKLQQQRNNVVLKDKEATSSSEESEENSEGTSDLSDSELESDSYFFLQPLPIKQRRALLRQSGIHQIEGVEKDECKSIRLSREHCGCQCKVYCDPDECQCAEAGIKCQVDRYSFPCGCSRDGCKNPQGRIEFNPVRVRTHFLHTLMRLEIEKRQQVQCGSKDEASHCVPKSESGKDSMEGSRDVSQWHATGSLIAGGAVLGLGCGRGDGKVMDEVETRTGGAASCSSLSFFPSSSHSIMPTANLEQCAAGGGTPLYGNFDSQSSDGTTSTSLFGNELDCDRGHLPGM